MMIQCSNARTLFITGRDDIEAEIDSSLTPYVVMLTAWDSESVSEVLQGNLVRDLLVKGARNFVCLGSFAEQLHDEIDELIYQFDDESGSELATDILTTYHSDESIEDVVNYYVCTTQFKDKEGSCLLAILNENSSEDREVRSFLEAA